MFNSAISAYLNRIFESEDIAVWENLKEREIMIPAAIYSEDQKLLLRIAKKAKESFPEDQRENLFDRDLQLNYRQLRLLFKNATTYQLLKNALDHEMQEAERAIAYQRHQEWVRESTLKKELESICDAPQIAEGLLGIEISVEELQQLFPSVAGCIQEVTLQEGVLKIFPTNALDVFLLGAAIKRKLGGCEEVKVSKDDSTKEYVEVSRNALHQLEQLILNQDRESLSRSSLPYFLDNFDTSQLNLKNWEE